MADTTDKEIRTSTEAFDDFNSSVRESINLTRELTKQVKKLPENLGFKKSTNEQLIRGIQEYKESLLDIQKISDRVAKGHANTKVVTDHIVALEAKYQKYLKENESSFAKRGRFLAKQRDIQKEIDKMQSKTKQADVDIDALRKDRIANEKILQTSTHYARRQDAKERIDDIDAKIKEEEHTIKYAERSIAKKLEEKGIIDKTIEAHKSIVEHYKEEIKGAETLKEELRKNSLYGKLTSKEFDKVIEGLKEIPGLLAPLAGAFEITKNFAFKISEQVTGIQKGLVLGFGAAIDVRQEFNDMSVSSNDLAINTARLVEGNAALGKELGFNGLFTRDLNTQFVKLTKQIGLSEEAAGGLAKLSKATGMNLEDTKNVALETSQRLSAQYGIQLDQKDVLEEIGKISGQTLAMLKANPKALAEAVAQARLLGVNLDTVKKQASFLLNFESSIEAELQAELLTGRALNLERARSAALTGDLTTSMRELNSQNITFGTFSNMNVIAQDKVAAALGLQSDELSDQLLKQQYLGKSKEQVEALAGKEVANRLEALSAQDRFNLAIEKMQDMVGTLVGGPLGRLVEMLASAAEHSWVLYAGIAAMAGISLVKLVTGLAASAVQAGILSVATVTTASALTLGVGAAAIIGGLLAVMAANASAKKEMTKPMADGGLLYGPTNVLAGEYQGAENNPEVIAPLSDLQNIIDKNKIVVNNTESPESAKMFQTLNETLRGVKDSIDQLNRKTGIVNIDGQRAGTAQLMGNYNLA